MPLFLRNTSMKYIDNFIPEGTASNIRRLLLEVVSTLRVREWFKGVTRKFGVASIEARMWD